MRVQALTLAAVLLVPTTSAALSRQELLDLCARKVDVTVILALVERDCVSFTITSSDVVEMRDKVPPSVLEAAIRCQKGRTSPEVAASANDPAETPVSQPAKAVSQPKPKVGWESAYPAAGQVFFIRIGDTREQFVATLGENGFSVDGPAPNVTCSRGTPKVNTEDCEFRTGDPAWKHLGGNTFSSDEKFSVILEDDRVNTIVHIIELDFAGETPQAYAGVRGALAKAYDRPAEKLGFFRRRFASALVPGAAILDGASWKREDYAAITLLCQRGVGRVIFIAMWDVLRAE